MESTRKCLIRKIEKECQEREVDVSSDLISFLLNLLALTPEFPGLRKDGEVDESKVNNDKIVQTVTEKLLDQSKPSLVILKIQLHFAKYYTTRDEIIQKHRLSLHQKTRPLVAEICETVQLVNDRDVERLYQKIAVVITLLSGLGNPTNPAVLREVTMALQSIYQPSELNHYVTLSKREKEEQLMELMCIVAGIRLFNRDCQRGGEGIDDLPYIVQQAITKTRTSIMEMLEELMKKVYKFTAAVANTLLSSNEEEDVDSNQLPPDITRESVEWAIEMLTATRQQEIYVRKLLADIECCENETKCLMKRLQGRLFKLHDTVRYKTAIPTVQVYPQFIDLVDIWMGLQDEVIALSHVNHFLWQLQALCVKCVNVYDDAALYNMIHGTRVLTDAERLERSMGTIISECGECSLFYPSVTKDFDKINLEFLGFCAWSFVAGKGALIPGNPNIGIVKWREKYFAFSSITAARKFGEDPNRYVYEALDLVRNHPEYVHLFQLYKDIEAMKYQEELVEEVPPLKIQRNQEVQTELHVVPSFIDKNYTSNIWEYKRRALQLATICRSATHSTQTYKSHFRSNVYAQAAPPKNKEVQTKRDCSTNTKTFKTFIFGLRGRHDDCQHVLSFAEDEFQHQ